MTIFSQKLMRIALSMEVEIKRFGDFLVRIFSSKAETIRRDSMLLEKLQRQEREAERIDRLIHPEDYRGR